MIKLLKSINIILVIASIFCCQLKSFAQLEVNPGISAAAMAEAIAGPGVQILNPQITGSSNSYGSYSTANTLLPFGNGVLLSTGKATNAIGPNNVQHKSYINSSAGSTLLDDTFNQITHDACVFEFDLIPQGDTLRFNFTFASEEYHNFVGSIYSDVFGFFISGPGITGNENLALVPGSGDPVSVNTINLVQNNNYLFDNDNPPGVDLQYNAYTVNLEAIRAVNPCETYHLTLVIADVNDYSIDSGVFIEKIESPNASLSSATAGGIEYMVEGCNDGELTFTRLSQDLSQDILITFYVDGTAINGVDYLPQIGSDPDPAVPKTIEILSGSSSSSIIISPVDDGIPNTDKYISIYLASTTCPDILYDSLFFPIFDSLIVNVGPDTALCDGTTIQLQTLAGGSSWSWTPSEFLNDPFIPNPVAQIDSTTLFTLYTTASFCEAWDSTLVEISNIQVNVDSLKSSCFGVDDGYIEISIEGGQAPYTVLWNGPTGFIDSSLVLSDLESGNYSYSISDAIGCEVSGQITLNTNSELMVNLSSTTLPFGYNIACHGDSTANIISTISGGSPDYQYLWSPGAQNTPDLFDVPAGNYALLVTDANNCIALDTIIISEAPVLSIVLDSLNNIDCAGEASAYIEVSGNGGVPAYNFTWNTNPPIYGPILQNQMAGAYTVTLVDAYDCFTSATFTISETSSILSYVLDSIINVECPGGNEGLIAVTATGGSAPYSYTWNTSPVQNTPTASNLVPGIYTLLIQDSLNCEVNALFEVELENDPLQASFSSISNVLCYGDSSGSAAITSTGGSGNYTYLWTPGSYTSSSVFNLPAGDYNVIVSDTGVCMESVSLDLTITQSSDSIEINLSSPLINGFNLSCFESGDASITSSTTGGNPPYTYHWTGPNGFSSSLPNLTNLNAGSYTLEITDQNGCSSSSTILLTQADEITLSFIMTPATCPTPGSNDGAIDITVTGGLSPYNYSWSGPNSFSSTLEDISNLEAGVYLVEVEDARSCKIIFSITVTQPDNFIVDPSFSLYPGNWNVSCYGTNNGSIDVLVSNLAEPAQYSWLYGGIEVSTDTFVTNALAGNYELIITDANNCIENRFYTLTEPDSILIDFNAFEDAFGNAISCYMGSDGDLTATISGGTPAYNWLWTYPDNTTSTDTIIQGLAEDTYSLLITDLNGCTQEDSISISAPDSLYALLTSPTVDGVNVTCFNGNNGSIITSVFGGTAPFSFQWIYPGGGIGSTDQNPGSLQEGLYILLLSDVNGCTFSDSINLVASDPILYSTIISDYNGYPNPCFGDSLADVEIIPSGGIAPYIVVWESGDTSQTMTGLAAGSYSGLIIDSEQCISTFNVVIDDPTALSVDFNISYFSPIYQIQCNGDSSGYIYSEISGGTPPYTINWSGPNGFISSNDSISGLVAGTYLFSLTDQNNCQYNASIQLNQPQLIQLEIVQLNSLSCAFDSTASLSAFASGGNGNFSYFWTGPNAFTSNLMTIENLPSGDYCVQVTDQNGCSANLCYTIDALLPLSISLSSPVFSGVNILCNGDSSGSITGVVSGGLPPYSYFWTGPNGAFVSSENPSGLIAGLYSIIVTDSLGCIATSSIDLSEADPILNSISTSNYNGYGVSCFGSDNGSITISSSDGFAPYSYVWTNQSDTISLNDTLINLYSDTYYVEVSDNNGCIVRDSVFISSPDSLVLSLFSPEVYDGINISCSNGNDGLIETFADGGVLNYTYSWTGPNGYVSNVSSIAQLSEGWYYLNLSDENLCMLQDSIELLSPDSLLTVNVLLSIQNSGTNVSCFGGNDATMTLSISGGIPNYQVYVQGPNGFSSNDSILTDLYAGIYFFSVVDSASCTFSQEIILTEPSDSLYGIPLVNDNICYGDSSGSVLLSPMGGSPSYTISWQGPDSFVSDAFTINDLSNGFYNYQLTDSNNCVFADSVEIVSATEMSANEIINNIACFGIDDGSILLQPSGGGSTYTYLWNGPNGFTSDQDSISDLESGEYCVSILSDLSCAADFCFEINESDSLYVNDTIIQPTCGYANGVILLEVFGGTSPYDVNWGSVGGLLLSSVPAGSYTALISDSLGCTYSFDYELIGPDSVNVDVSIQNISCYANADGSILIQLSGGTPSYDLQWSGPDGFYSSELAIDSLQNGIYQLDVIDSLGCSLYEEYEIVMPDSISVDFYSIVYDNGYNVSANGANDGFIGISTINGGNPNFNLSWIGPNGFTSTSMNISNLYAGFYQLNVIDANNCEGNFQVILSEPESALIPTGFTPNNDGFNDLFVIPGISIENPASIKIYNRWGNSVYENSNYENDWDGTNKSGDDLPEGTYFVIIEFLKNGNSYSGYIDLRR